MTYYEYKAKRQKLIDEAQSFIDSGDTEKANMRMTDIDALDAEWEAIAQRLADEKALSDNQRVINLENYAVKASKDAVVTDSIYMGVGIPSDSLYLKRGQSMMNHIKMDADAVKLRNKSGALGDAIRGVVTGKWDDPVLRNAVTTTTGGVLIPSVLSAGIIDLLRNTSLFTAAGVPVVPMETNNLTIARLASDPEFAFKEEAAEGVEGSLSFDSVTLNAKTVYGYCYLSIEAINSARNLDSIVKKAFAEAMARAIDKALLYGQADGEGGFDAFAPEGIWNNSDVLSVTPNEDENLFDTFIRAKYKIAGYNADATALAVNSNTDEAMSLAKDLEGRYLPMPGVLSNLDKVVSNQLNHDASDGDDALVFDPAALVIGLQENIRIEPVQDEKCLKRGLQAFRIYAMVDAAVLQPKAVCKVSEICKISESDENP